MNDDETVRQVRLSSCQPFIDVETGHGTIPLLFQKGWPQARVVI